MELRVGSWNVEGRLSDSGVTNRGKPSQIVAAIKKLDADILVLLEAHSEDSIDNLTCRKQLNDMGYYLKSVNYQDDMTSRKDTYAKQLSLILLSKLPIDKFEIIRLGDFRNAFVAIIHNDKANWSLRVIGLHLDDRLESTRLKQIADLSNVINQSSLPTVVMGDFNAMHGDDLWPAKFLNSKFIHKLSGVILPKISKKAVGMASGDTLHMLQARTNLRDADMQHKPTTTPKMRGLEWMPSIRLIQIDHIFLSSNIQVEQFQIAPDAGADHRAITAILQLSDTLNDIATSVQ